MIDWIYTEHASIDLRMAAFACKDGKITSEITFGQCNLYQISPFSNLPACYTTEGIKYAQSAYFYSTVIAQIFNAFVCKTRKLSFINQGIDNTFLIFAITTEILLIIIAAYCYPFNIVFGTRDNIFMQFGFAVFPFAMLQLVID